MTLALILAGVVALVAVAVAPLLLPWQDHVRWLVATNAAADRWVPGAGVNVRMEEVRVVRRTGDVVWLARQGAPDRHTLSLSTSVGADLRWLDHWAFADTPLVLVTHPDTTVSLHSPSRAIVGLRPIVEPVESQLGDLVEHWLQHVGEVTR